MTNKQMHNDLSVYQTSYKVSMKYYTCIQCDKHYDTERLYDFKHLVNRLFKLMNEL